MKSMTNSGLSAWIWQRVTAVLMLFYSVPILLFWVVWSGSYDLAVWHQLLWHPAMRVLGMLTMLSATVHAVIGLWVVATDYIQVESLQRMVLCFFYGITILSLVIALVIMSIY